jgi:hypothetical protein
LLRGGNKRRAEKHQTAVARELLDSIYDELRCTEEISMPSRQFRGVLWAGGGCVILEAADRGASSLTSANVPPTSAIDIAPHDRVRAPAARPGVWSWCVFVIAVVVHARVV